MSLGPVRPLAPAQRNVWSRGKTGLSVDVPGRAGFLTRTRLDPNARGGRTMDGPHAARVPRQIGGRRRAGCRARKRCRTALPRLPLRPSSFDVADMDWVTIPLLRTPPRSAVRIGIDADSLHLPQDFEDRTADGRVGHSDRIPLREVVVVLEDRVGGAATRIAERLV